MGLNIWRSENPLIHFIKNQDLSKDKDNFEYDRRPRASNTALEEAEFGRHRVKIRE